MSVRKFDQESYNVNDDYARLTLSNYLKNKGYTIKSNLSVEDYKCDIIAEKDGETVRFEVQVATAKWTSREDFPYDKVNFAERKRKILENEGDFFYVIMNKDGYALCARGSEIYDPQTSQVKSMWSRRDNGAEGMDFYFRLDKNKVSFFKIK